MASQTKAPGLNRYSTVPLYDQLAQSIKAQLDAGAWGASGMLPSEGALCDLYGVSRTVVRQALDGLERTGAIYRIKGKGSFVAERKIRTHLLQDASGFHANVEAQGLAIETRVLKQERIAAPPDIAEALQIESGAAVVSIERLRIVSGEPVFLGTSYVAVERCGDLSDAEFTNDSLNRILACRCGMQPSGGRRVIEATGAGRYQAEMLQVSQGTPLFQLFAVTLDQRGRPMECSRIWLRGDRVAFEVTLQQPAEAIPCR